ncbi:MAG: aldehyde dehydrogenase family protein, partial [Deltaproteobacteria bacterium]|nr:aldehyde dehydrogenase family protein [Deltaproteobacteria bacterium]
DLGKCIPMALRSRMLNCGQSCIAAKRFILTEPIAKEFEERFLKAVEVQRVGDPMMRETNIGPLAREDLLQNLSRQVEASKRRGALCLHGGERLSRKGYFYLPTVLKEVEPGMAAFEEETFGPVASLITAKDEEEAIDLANRTPYGLGASLWTKNLEKAERVAAKIDAGSVFINGMTKSDPRLPFGGTKRSGLGRELSSFGIQEFTNLKTVWIA